MRIYDPTAFSLLKARMRLTDEGRDDVREMVILVLLLALIVVAVLVLLPRYSVGMWVAVFLGLVYEGIWFERRRRVRAVQRGEIDQGLAMLRERWREVPHG